MKLHNFDAVSFVLGLLFTGLGVVFVTGQHRLGWIVPIVLIGIGLAIAAAAIQRALTSTKETED